MNLSEQEIAIAKATSSLRHDNLMLQRRVDSLLKEVEQLKSLCNTLYSERDELSARLKRVKDIICPETSAKVVVGQ